MVRINLLPDTVLERRRHARIRRMANIGIVLWAGLVVVVLLIVLGYQQYHSAALNSAKDERSEVKDEAYSEDNMELREEALTVQSSLDSLSTVISQRQLKEDFWLTMSETTTENVSLTSLNFDNDNELSIQGEALSYEDVSEYERALKATSENREHDINNEDNENIGYFTSVQLSSTSIPDEGGASFTMSAMYHAPSEVSTEEPLENQDSLEDENGE